MSLTKSFRNPLLQLHRARHMFGTARGRGVYVRCICMCVGVGVTPCHPPSPPCLPHCTLGCSLLSFPHDAAQPMNTDVCWSWFLTLLPAHQTHPATYGFVLRIIWDMPPFPHPLAIDLRRSAPQSRHQVSQPTGGGGGVRSFINRSGISGFTAWIYYEADEA